MLRRIFSGMKGYGLLIANAMDAAGYTPEQLSVRLGKTKGIAYRFVQEKQEPTADQINILAALLPLSVEDLLRAMGVRLYTPEVTRIPNQLRDLLVEMSPSQHQALIDLLSPASGPRSRPGSRAAPAPP